MNTRFARTALPTLLVAAPLLAASLLAACLLTVACSGTETDNPVADVGTPPDYRSPIRFEPAPPAPPGCAPSDADGPPRLPLWGLSGNHLVGIDAVTWSRRGLVVVDVSDPAAPRIVAEQPLSGYPRQLLVEGDSATLVLDEFPQLAGAPVPPAEALEAQTKLVRFDLSTPTAPRRVAELVLDDEFWQLQARGDGYWLLSGHIDPATQRCDVAANWCGYVARDGMSLTRHTWSGTGWVTGERVELPAGPRVWLTEAGFATAGSAGGSAEQLSFAVFEGDGSLGPVRTLPLEGGVVSGSALYLDSQRVGVFGFDPSDGQGGFALYALDGTPLGRVDLPDQSSGRGAQLVSGGALVGSGEPGELGLYLDLGEPGAPALVALPQASAFLPLAAPGSVATRALGWRSDASGSSTTFTLWSLETSPPTLLDSLPTTLPAPESSSELQLSGERVVFSLRGAGNAPLTGSLRWDGDALSIAGPIAGGYGNPVFAVGDWLYTPDFSGLVFGNPGQGSVQRQTWDEGELLDVVAVPGGEARLVRDYSRTALQLFVTRAGVTQSMAMGPGARRLLPAGERVIVVSPEPRDQCEQTGLDCSGYAPNLAIVELAPLAVAAELPLPELPVPALSSQSRVEQTWTNSLDITQSPVRLGEQSWLLENEWSGTCLSEADCAALGIQPVPFGQANVNPGQQSCAPGVTSCPQPAPPTVYGQARRRVFYVLDAAAASLSAPLVVEPERGTPYELWTRPVYSQGTLLDLHLEPSSFSRSGGPEPTVSAFLLERYVPNAAGGLDPLPVINIPGYPVGLLADSELLSLEPAPGLAGTAQLHRLRLAGSGATVVASRALAARVGEVKLVGQSAVYLRAPADSCEPVSHVDIIALDPQLSPRGSLQLPGDGWQVLGTEAAGLVLQRGSGFAWVAIDEQGNASVAHFATAPIPVGRARWDEDGVVRAISANRVIRLQP